MLSWLGKFLRSSIGTKIVTAIGGLLLVGFLIAHLSGNLLLYKGDGAAFEAYAAKLHDLGPGLLVMELGLVALFALHIGFALRSTLINRAGRKTEYKVATNHGERSLASSTMPITGLIVLLFLILHLLDFRFSGDFKDPFKDGGHGAGTALVVWNELAEPLEALIYLLGVAALTLHLVHAIPSALQTLGINHPHLSPWLGKVGVSLAVLLGLGFASLPVAALIR